MTTLDLYLPVCSKCGHSLTQSTHPVSMQCLHLYCFQCASHLITCYIDGHMKGQLTDVTSSIDKLIVSFGTPEFQSELKSFQESVNVSLVNCSRGNKCVIQATCPYSHPYIEAEEENSGSWKCVNCNLTVEADSCPFCYKAKPESRIKLSKPVLVLKLVIMLILALSLIICHLISKLSLNSKRSQGHSKFHSH